MNQTKKHFLILHFAFCILHFAFPFPPLLYSQEKTGFIYPGSLFRNSTGDTICFLPKQKLEILMDREEISAALIQTLEARNSVSDSLLSLKTFEAQQWYTRLLERDQLLEESELIRVQERQKARKRTRAWFGAGTLTGLLIGVIVF